MLGSSCSPCCGWRCYVTEDADGAYPPTNFRFDSFQCDSDDPTRVYARLEFDIPLPVDCVPRMLCEIQVGIPGETPGWQTAFLYNGETAKYLTRTDGILGVAVKCDYAALYSVAGQTEYYRQYGANQIRAVRFRIRSEATSGPQMGDKSQWVYLSADVQDPRSVSFSTAATFNTSASAPVGNLWQFAAPVSGCGINIYGRFDIKQTVAYRNFPASPVWSPLLLSNSSWSTTQNYSLNLAPSSGVVSGYGVGDNPYGNASPEDSSSVGRTWLMAYHRDAPEVMTISNINATSIGGV